MPLKRWHDKDNLQSDKRKYDIPDRWFPFFGILIALVAIVPFAVTALGIWNIKDAESNFEQIIGDAEQTTGEFKKELEGAVAARKKQDKEMETLITARVAITESGADLFQAMASLIEAQAAHSRSDYVKAERMIEKVEDQLGKGESALVVTCEMSHSDGTSDKKCKGWKDVFEQMKRKTYMLLARVGWHSGRRELTIEAGEKLIQASGKKKDGFHFRALGRMQDLPKLLEEHPESVRVKQEKKILGDLKKSTELEPEENSDWLNLVEIHFLQGDFKKAEEAMIDADSYIGDDNGQLSKLKVCLRSALDLINEQKRDLSRYPSDASTEIARCESLAYKKDAEEEVHPTIKVCSPLWEISGGTTRLNEHALVAFSQRLKKGDYSKEITSEHVRKVLLCAFDPEKHEASASKDDETAVTSRLSMVTGVHERTEREDSRH